MRLEEIKLKWRKTLAVMCTLPDEHPPATLSEQMLKLQADIVKDFIKDLDELSPPDQPSLRRANNLAGTI
jgi:hypothetical protein